MLAQGLTKRSGAGSRLISESPRMVGLETRGLEAPDQGTVEGRELSLRVEAPQGAQNGLTLRWRKSNQSGAVFPSEEKRRGSPREIYKGEAGGGPSPGRDVG